MVLVVLRIALVIAVLMAIHFGLDWWMRRQRARRLEREHAEHAEKALSREDYVARGLAKYDRSLERRLLIGIYVVPVLLALGLALLANYG